VKKQESISKTILKYSSSNIYRRALGILSVLIKPKFLSPEYYGILNLLTLIPRYATFLDLGTREAMRYLLASYSEKDKKKEIEELKKTIFLGTLLTYIPAAIAITLVGLLGDFKIEIRVGLATMSVAVIVTWYFEFRRSVLMSQEQFPLLTQISYLNGTVSVLSSIVLVILMNIYGAYLSLLLSEVVIICYLWIKVPLRMRGSFSFPLLSSLVKKGLVIMSFGFSLALIRTSDRLVISFLMGYESLGYYSIALMVINSLMLIPGASREVLEPRLVKNMIKNDLSHSLSEFLFKPILNSAYYLPLLIGPFFFILPAGVPLFLPKYIPGILPAQILIMGTYYLAMCYLMRGFVIAHKWHFKIFGVMAANLAFSISLVACLIKLNLGLEGAALGGSLSNFILFTSLYVFIMHQSKLPNLKWLKHYLSLHIPFFCMLSLCFGISLAFGGFRYPAILSLIAELVCYLLLMIGIIFLAKKFIPALKSFKEAENLLKQIDIEEEKKDDDTLSSNS